jgi:hypothetical protein
MSYIAKFMIGFFTFIFLSMSIQAEIYSWTDDQGRKHFGDKDKLPSESSVEVKLKPMNTMDEMHRTVSDGETARDKHLQLKKDLAEEIKKENKLRAEAIKWKNKNCPSVQVFAGHGGMNSDGTRQVNTTSVQKCSGAIPGKYARFIRR